MIWGHPHLWKSSYKLIFKKGGKTMKLDMAKKTKTPFHGSQQAQQSVSPVHLVVPKLARRVWPSTANPSTASVPMCFVRNNSWKKWEVGKSIKYMNIYIEYIKIYIHTEGILWANQITYFQVGGTLSCKPSRTWPTNLRRCPGWAKDLNCNKCLFRLFEGQVPGARNTRWRWKGQTTSMFPHK